MTKVRVWKSGEKLLQQSCFLANAEANVVPRSLKKWRSVSQEVRALLTLHVKHENLSLNIILSKTVQRCDSAKILIW